jgi:hypothetical protein
MTSPATPNRAAPTPPENPRIQAVSFALQLADFRSTLSPKEGTPVQLLLSDAAEINTFLAGGQS